MESTNDNFDRSGSRETSHSRSSSSALAIQGHQPHQAILRSMEEVGTLGSIKSGVQVFPVIPFHLSLYIAHLVQSGLKSSIMTTAAMKYVHSLAGFQNPAVDPLVTLALEGHKRITATPTLRKEPIAAIILLKLLGSHGHSNATLADLHTLFVSFISFWDFTTSLRLQGKTAPFHKTA